MRVETILSCNGNDFVYRLVESFHLSLGFRVDGRNYDPWSLGVAQLYWLALCGVYLWHWHSKQVFSKSSMRVLYLATSTCALSFLLSLTGLGVLACEIYELNITRNNNFNRDLGSMDENGYLRIEGRIKVCSDIMRAMVGFL